MIEGDTQRCFQATIRRFVDPDLDPVQAGRTVEVVLHVLFAGPDQRRLADRPGDPRRLEREVELEPPAEAAAEERGVDDDRLGR